MQNSLIGLPGKALRSECEPTSLAGELLCWAAYGQRVQGYSSDGFYSGSVRPFLRPRPRPPPPRVVREGEAFPHPHY
jgi:hypothetical protein